VRSGVVARFACLLLVLWLGACAVVPAPELPCRGSTGDCLGASWQAFGARFIATEDSVTAIELRRKSVFLIEKARTDVLLEVAVVDGTVTEIGIVSPAQPYRHDLATGRFMPRAPGRTASFSLQKEQRAR
jgi:hypothetical protein